MCVCTQNIEKWKEEISEMLVKDMSVTRALTRIMQGRNVLVEVKKGSRKNFLLPLLTYGSGTWTWKKAQQSRVHAVEKEVSERDM